MVRGAAGCVRPGGLLVVITCSIEPEENEAVAAAFLESRTGFGRRDLANDLRRPAVEHVAGPGVWRLLPADDHDGFTVQVLERTGD